MNRFALRAIITLGGVFFVIGVVSHADQAEKVLEPIIIPLVLVLCLLTVILAYASEVLAVWVGRFVAKARFCASFQKRTGNTRALFSTDGAWSEDVVKSAIIEKVSTI